MDSPISPSIPSTLAPNSSLPGFASLFRSPSASQDDTSDRFNDLQQCFNEATVTSVHRVIQLRTALDRWKHIRRFNPMYKKTLLTPWLLSQAPVSQQDWTSALQSAWKQSAHHADDRIARLAEAEVHTAELVGWLAQWERRRWQLSRTAKSSSDRDEDFEHLQQELHGLVQNGAGITDPDDGTNSNTSRLIGTIQSAIAQRQQLHKGEQSSLAPAAVAFRWPIIAGGLIALALTTGFWRGFNMTEWVTERAQDIYVTVTNFAKARLITPAVEMYQSIRYDKGHLAVQLAKSSEAELASLQRMVSEYALDAGRATQDELAALEELAAQGDLTVVMKDFEAGLRTPVKGVIAGRLLRTVLIQVQKAKVDMQQALSGMDKLMKSNELTFQLIALMPAVLLTYATITTLWGMSVGRFNRKSQVTARKIQACLQEIERAILNACVCEPEEWLQYEGELVIACVQAAEQINASKQLTKEAKVEMCDDLAGVLAAVDEGFVAKRSPRSNDNHDTSDDNDDNDADFDAAALAEEQGGHEYFERVASRRSRRLSLIRMTMNAEMSKLTSGQGLMFVF
eukprot:m.192997 g.192997  ORF g.192997 m.192997 type:complete len:568 (+) comp16971_c0_seq5:158-1861(+)